MVELQESDGSKATIACQNHDDPKLFSMVRIYVKACAKGSTLYRSRLKKFYIRLGSGTSLGDARAQGLHLRNVHRDALALLEMRTRADANSGYYFIEFGPVLTRLEGSSLCGALKVPVCEIEPE